MAPRAGGTRAGVWGACLLLHLLASTAGGQTGLLVVVSGGDRDWSLIVRDAVAQVRWPSGPVEMAVLPRGNGARRAWHAALGDLRQRGATAVIVVPLPRAPADALLATVSGMPTAPNIHITPPPEVVHDLGVARWIERRAAAPGPTVDTVPGTAPYRLPTMNVTGTRTVRSATGTPASVAVLDRERLTAHWATTAADPFREVPGLDVEGVGANQRRPAIRGLFGQRILLLADGLRLNNSRRRQDTGETPGLIDLTTIDRIEVIKGPASILYGSDAVGGVVNLIELTPDVDPGAGLTSGTVRLRYRSVDRQVSPALSATLRQQRLAVRVAGSYRHAATYDAPAGTFGTVTLDSAVRVQDTGVEDYHGSLAAAYRLAPGHELFAKYQLYSASDAGFGLVDPSLLGEGLPEIRITFPDQRFDRATLRYRGTNLRVGLLNQLSVAAYWQRNRRQFDSDMFSPIGPPGSGVSVASRNFTDIDTYGFRLEAQRAFAGGHTVTYGVDLFHDRSLGTDSTRTTVTMGADTTVRERNAPRLPTATFRSGGVFAQSELSLVHRAVLVLGARYQNVATRTQPTEGISDPLVRATDHTVVGAANLLLSITSEMQLVAAVGSAFRSPNLVERFFAGPSPEGRGIWIPNLDLQPERSLNVETGVRYRSQAVAFDASVFRNTIRDAIRVDVTGNVVNGVPEFQHRNVEQLRYSGIEVAGEVRIARRLILGGDFSRVVGRNVRDPEQLLGDGYAHRLRGRARYTDPDDRFHLEYVVRHHGRRDDADLGRAPVLPYIPAFTVHALRGGIGVMRGLRLEIAVENLTDALYAEATNVGFFRPEPRRHLTLDVAWAF